MDADNEATAVRVLELRGYQVETDWRPVRVELAAPGLGWVDLHPVVFDVTGNGRQADVDGGHFDYPPEAFDESVLAGVPVSCLSWRQQVRFHSGYPPRAADLHDLHQLEQLPDGP